jgi:hypothetical protein
MKLDSNRAWQEAVAAVSANKEVLLGLAGVFFVLPSLAFALFFPQPEPAGAMQPEAVMRMMQTYYISILPFALPMAILQMVGSLAVLTLFTDRRRPTVGQAIKQGAMGVLPYLGTSLLLGIAVGLIGGLLLALAGLTGSKVIASIVVIALAAALLYAGVRLSLIAPVVAVDRIRNPMEIIRRSWSLTEGNAGRIALFLLLVLVVFGIVAVIVMGLVGVVLALALAGSTAKTLAAVFSSLIGSIFSTYFLAINAAIHRQLSGPSAGAISGTFD